MRLEGSTFLIVKRDGNVYAWVTGEGGRSCRFDYTNAKGRLSKITTTGRKEKIDLLA